ncbi:hypothetical protein DYI37_13865 [Fulvimarina endophytica]|uniref:Uncharacterized protein n=1 Tax=Fulvimarina endophytica TaxID=2293836 RepID=A0A371X1B4_9HYPH|nr:hypothetical protein DYI37_13865 [Fulvimarina endophytica]
MGRPLRGAVSPRAEDGRLGKLFSLLFILLMGLHLIRPLGLPGLRRRSDFWKIAFAGIVVFSVVVLLRP